MDSTAKKCDCLTRQHRGEEPSKMTRTLRNVAMRWVVFTGALLTVPCSFASSIGKPPLETIPVPDVAPLPEVSRADDSQSRLIRSEERRVGKECVSTCRSRWWPNH